MAEYYDSSGNKITLGGKLGEGGEGAVYNILQKPELVAKIYHKPISTQKSLKLIAMAKGSSDELLKIASWPVEVISKANNSDISGLLMPRIHGFKPVHELYSPRSRRSEFPNSDWRFLLHTSANIARAFAAIHKNSHVIGDVNHGNVIVNQAGIVKMIDCDSFQITYNGQIYSCEVGVPEYTPPEMQGKNFNIFHRTKQHDLFGLAVLIFHMLFMGRHPFAGRFSGKGDMPIAKAIKELRFAYGITAPFSNMQPPPHTLNFDEIPISLSNLFSRAFSKDAIKYQNRPNAQEWIIELSAILAQINQCQRVDSHYFLNSQNACPWCDLEAQLGIHLFIVTHPLAQSGVFQIETVWNRILAIKPPPDFSFPQPVKLKPSAKAQKIRQTSILLALTGIAAAVIFFFFIFPILNNKNAMPFILIGFIAEFFLFKRITLAHKQFKKPYKQASSRHDAIKREWEKEASNDKFQQKIKEFEKIKNDHKDLPNKRLRGLEILQTKLHEKQLEHFLEKFRIEKEKIDSVGPERKLMLLSYGVETAADVTKKNVMKVPGFGTKLTENLLKWRAEKEKDFVFNPSIGINSQDIYDLDQELAAEKKQIENALTNAPSILSQLRQEIQMKRNRLQNKYNAIAKEYYQAKANLDAARLI